MKKFKNHQRPRRKYRFNIVGHKKALKIWSDSPFKDIHINFGTLGLFWAKHSSFEDAKTICKEHFGARK